MPEYVAPTISDTGDAFPVTFPVELAGTVVFVDFEVQEYTPPDSTNVNFDVGGSFESASVSLSLSPSITETTQAFESPSVSLSLSPEITNTEVVPIIFENLTEFDYGEAFPATFPVELGGNEPAGLLFDVSIQEFSQDEQIYGETLGVGEQTITQLATAESDVVVLAIAEKSITDLANAEID